ncbi:MAG TPA: pitrilysin family protein [Thermoanaerobaculia bacterium]|nr:pitrilysin family protein [Thermoanaerobaculia bacterium]
MRFSPRPALAIVLIFGCAVLARAQDLRSFEKKVTTKVLDNGLTLIVVERPEAPVFSFFVHVDAGSSQEVPGITGLAHMFEHMAFKGTDKIGTTDWPAEKVALERVESAYAAYSRERLRQTGRDEARLAELEKGWRDAMAAADQYVIPSEFEEILEREGGRDANAFTSNDETAYFYSMPSNRLELWAHLESERFLTPVMREFYKERDVVVEERRMRVESDPFGILFEEFLAQAFAAHPYGLPGTGWPSDLESFSATDAMEFYRTYYVPANMVVAVVGDVRAGEVIPLAEKYYGRLPSGAEPPTLRTVEPPQSGERTVLLRLSAQPVYLEGYHKPSTLHPDDSIYEVIGDLMSTGRTSRLYRALVRDQRIAAWSAGFNGLPGEKYPNLFAFAAIPTPGHTPGELRRAIHAEIERLKKEDVTDEELRMVKTRAKAALIRGLDSNAGLAAQLATAHARHGDWRELFRQVDKIEKVTKADIRRVANEVFVESNRTVGIIETRTTGTPSQEGTDE